MRDILRLFALASRLSSGEGATFNEILKSGIGYTSRSSIYADFQMLSERFMIPVYDSDERRGISGREVVKYIDKDIWNGQTVTPQDTVLISGELDKDGDRTKLDVERLMKKQTVVK